MRPAWLTLILLSLCANGCASWPLSSKWAAGNADYAEKYDRPYPKKDAKRYARMAKQAVDARHVEGMTGVVGGLAVQDDPVALGAELGWSHYPTSWLETRASLAGVLADNDNDDEEEIGQNAFIGINAGTRLCTPTRIAPFIGVGGYGGMSWFVEEAENDGIDNDDDLFIDELGETDWGHDYLLAVYPEVGVHFWLNQNLRVTGSAAYYITSEGRDHDFWFFGLSLGWFSDPNFSGHAPPSGDLKIDWPTPEVSGDPLSRLPSP